MGMDSIVQCMYTMRMGNGRLAMVYLRVLRERHGYSRAVLARMSGLAEKQLYRWEKSGRGLPNASELGIWAQAVQASFEDLGELLQSSGLSEAAAAAMADDRWEELQDPQNTAVQQALDIIGQLRAHPVQFGRWLERGVQLLSEVDGSP